MKTTIFKFLVLSFLVMGFSSLAGAQVVPTTEQEKRDYLEKQKIFEDLRKKYTLTPEEIEKRSVILEEFRKKHSLPSGEQMEKEAPYVSNSQEPTIDNAGGFLEMCKPYFEPNKIHPGKEPQICQSYILGVYLALSYDTLERKNNSLPKGTFCFNSKAGRPEVIMNRFKKYVTGNPEIAKESTIKALYQMLSEDQKCE